MPEPEKVVKKDPAEVIVEAINERRIAAARELGLPDDTQHHVIMLKRLKPEWKPPGDRKS